MAGERRTDPLYVASTAVLADSDDNEVAVANVNSTRTVAVRDEALLTILAEILEELRLLRAAQEGD